MSIGPTFAANGPTSTILQINMTIRGGGKEVVFTLYQRFALFWCFKLFCEHDNVRLIVVGWSKELVKVTKFTIESSNPNWTLLPHVLQRW